MGRADQPPARTPSCSARRWATASASATPSSGPRSSATYSCHGDECVFGGGKTLRDGLGTHGGVTARRRRARLRDHERAGRSTPCRGSSRPTSASRTDASPASARPATRRLMDGVDPGHGRRREHRRPLGGGHDRDRRRHRRARPLRLGRPLRGGDRGRGHDDARRRARAGHRRHLLLGHRRTSAACCRRPRRSRSTSASSARARRTPSSRCSSRSAPARSGSRSTRTGARCRRSSTPRCDAGDELDVQVQIHTDTLNESGFFERHDGRDRRPDDPHLPLGGRRRRARPGHHPRRRRGELPAVLDEPDEPVHASTRSTSTSTW